MVGLFYFLNVVGSEFVNVGVSHLSYFETHLDHRHVNYHHRRHRFGGC
jgi:hypothetical protein